MSTIIERQYRRQYFKSIDLLVRKRVSSPPLSIIDKKKKYKDFPPFVMICYQIVYPFGLQSPPNIFFHVMVLQRRSYI